MSNVISEVSVTPAVGAEAPKSKLASFLNGIPPVAIIALVAWMLFGKISLLYLASQVPLSAQILSHASWLGSPVLALHFTTGPMGVALSLMMLLVGAAIGFSRYSIMPFIPALAVAVLMGLGDGEGDVVRIGLLEDGIKLGCFVDSAECRDMLKIEKGSAPSMYVHSTDMARQGEYTASYEHSRDKIIQEHSSWALLTTTIPFAAMFRAPLYVTSADVLKHKIETQETELQNFKKQAK